MMSTHTRWATAILLILGLMAIGCASGDGKIDLRKIPIIIGVPPVQTMPQEPAPAPVKPRATVAFHVVDDMSGQPIPTAIATFEDGTQLQANDDGYIAVEKELNTYQVTISADDYQTATRNVLLTGNRQFAVRLTSTKPAPAPPTPEPPPIDPPKADPPKPSGVVVHCGAGENTLRVSQACVTAVAEASIFWPRCHDGSQRDCHYFIREVASALRIAQQDDRWGIVEKRAGENVDGFAEDVVAYLPPPFALDQKTWQWRGVDLVGGSGAPGARLLWGELHPAVKCFDGYVGPWCNREDMSWAPVPR